MRLLLAILMLTLLPLQISAAAMSSCCGHAEASQVFLPKGHQPHHVFAAQLARDVASEGTGIDVDCGACHVNCAAAVMAMIETHIDTAANVLSAYQAQGNSPPWHEQPDRPQWHIPRHSGLSVFA
ncbi:MAG: hypothetical protein IBJ04_06275 [Hydrogenophaga sp.]|uniref:hypothetical protein n=1 Tax=Hydrogenophaga sp. TaxID=1904254 RepID=UPI00257F715A|nr:hypothetical protein [Hydrogenophaga sp.]MBL0943918.1 hypothetical protein [Hydrogenophaga sp.]